METRSSGGKQTWDVFIRVRLQKLTVDQLIDVTWSPSCHHVSKAQKKTSRITITLWKTTIPSIFLVQPETPQNSRWTFENESPSKMSEKCPRKALPTQKKTGTFYLSHRRTLSALPISSTLQIWNIHSHTTMLDELSNIITRHSFRKKRKSLRLEVWHVPQRLFFFCWLKTSTSQQKWPNGLLVQAAKSSKNSSKLKSPSPLKSKPGGLREAPSNQGSWWFDSSTPPKFNMEPEKWWVFQEELPFLGVPGPSHNHGNGKNGEFWPCKMSLVCKEMGPFSTDPWLLEKEWFKS